MSIFDELTTGIETRSEAETHAVAHRVAAVLPVDTVLALHGDLGVGKTTFVRGLAQAWGIDEAVRSPTFGILALHRGERTLVHIDAYRLSTGEQLADLSPEEFMDSPWCVAVEWPDKVTSWLPPATRHIHFSITAPGVHHLALLANP